MTRKCRVQNERRCRSIIDSSTPLRIDDLDWLEIAMTPMAPRVIDCRVYMRDVEGFTDRDLDGLTAHRTTLTDPLIADFLPLWRREEAGHTAALERFLRHTPTAARPGPVRQPPATEPAPPLEERSPRSPGRSVPSSPSPA